MQNTILAHNKSFPYYIFAPSYVQTSAGIKILHYLCHHLNILGYPAFLVPINRKKYLVNPYLITPIITEEMFENHKKHSLTPIVIYPDITIKNILNVNFFVHYLLHYPGFLAKQDNLIFDKPVFAYSKKIAEKTNCINFDINTLFMPIFDTSIFYPPKNDNKRSGMVFYASKYKNVFHQKTFAITDNAIEITRDEPSSQTTQQVAELFRTAEVFATYEETSLINEAILCDCPVLLIKNQYFNDDFLTEYELGKYACFSDYNQESLAIAKSQIPLAKQKIFESILNFKSQLQNFITETQKHVQNYPFPDNFNKKYLWHGKFSKIIKYKISNYLNKLQRH